MGVCTVGPGHHCATAGVCESALVPGSRHLVALRLQRGQILREAISPVQGHGGFAASGPNPVPQTRPRTGSHPQRCGQNRRRLDLKSEPCRHLQVCPPIGSSMEYMKAKVCSGSGSVTRKYQPSKKTTGTAIPVIAAMGRLQRMKSGHYSTHCGTYCQPFLI